MRLIHNRALISLAVTLLVVAGVWALGLGYIAHKSATIDDALIGLEPRYQRLQGLRDASVEIERGLAEGRATLTRGAYPATHPLDRIGPEVQQRLRVAAEAAGVSVAGSQIVAATTSAASDTALDVVQVVLNLEGDMAQIFTLFDKIAVQSPAVYLDALELRPAIRSGERLAARVQFSVLRVQE